MEIDQGREISKDSDGGSSHDQNRAMIEDIRNSSKCYKKKTNKKWHKKGQLITMQNYSF